MRRRARSRAGAAVRRMLRQEDGSVLVETLLSTMLVMTLVLAIIECSMMAYTYSVYQDAAEQGVRYATVHGTDSTSCSGPSVGCADSTGANVSSAVTSFAQSYVAYIKGMTILVTYPDSSSAPPSRVEVSITYTYKPLFGLPGFSRSFNVSSEGRIVY